MEKTNYIPWSRLVYYVSSVYRVTGKFKPGIQHGLGERIRRTAVTISADVNGIGAGAAGNAEKSQLYLILSTLSVLETYLQIAKQHKLIKDTRVLDEELAEVREGILNVLMC